jgi:6-phosphogluconolactonase
MKKALIFRVYQDKDHLAAAFAGIMAGMIRKAYHRKAPFSIALSGGRTPGLLFSLLAEEYKDRIDWKRVNFYWVDERCVPPDDPDSNYGMTKRTLFDKIEIPESNIFRMKGEADPQFEARSYSELILNKLRKRNGLPCFDLVLLGMGDDGHTASIFPGNERLLRSNVICAATDHPVTHQRRLTLTGKVINNAGVVYFIVTGESKAGVVETIYRNGAGVKKFPAAHIRSVNGLTFWLLDNESGLFLN